MVRGKPDMPGRNSSEMGSGRPARHYHREQGWQAGPANMATSTIDPRRQ
jgi:hypothetical protein